MTLPDKLPQFIEAGLKHPTERHRYSPLISQAEFDLIRKDEDLVQIFAQDSMNFEGHMKHLCRLFNRFKGALNGSSSEVTIRRAVDDLLELAFETDPNALVNSSYLWVPLPSCCMRAHLSTAWKLKLTLSNTYDERRLPHRPTSVATADGAVGPIDQFCQGDDS
jgi:hypothetical protein